MFFLSHLDDFSSFANFYDQQPQQLKYNPGGGKDSGKSSCSLQQLNQCFPWVNIRLINLITFFYLYCSLIISPRLSWTLLALLVLKYLEESKKAVIVAESSLKKIMETLDLKEIWTRSDTNTRLRITSE